MIVLQPGTVIADGLYTLRRQLGTGATAHVWAATQKLPDGQLRDIVLKILLPEIRLDPKKREMFLEEARLAATLHHPAIVEVYSIDQTQEFDFLVMERIWGAELDELIEGVKKEKSNIPWPLAVAMIRDAAQGIHYANTLHDRNGIHLNLVHRDIKPGNLLLDIYGQIKVIDFGIAKTATSHLKTQTGIIKGTIAYMSPEHLRSEKLDVRSDIYALTVVLYELCTGYRPFAGENMTSVMFSILTQEPYDPQTLREGLPQDLSQLLLKNLSKDKENRSPYAETFVQELDDLLQHHNQEITPHSLRAYLKKYKPDLFEEYKEIHGSEPEEPSSEHAETQALSASLANQETQAISHGTHGLHDDHTSRLPGAPPSRPTGTSMPAIVLDNFDISTLSDDVRDTIAQGEGAQLPDYVRQLAQQIIAGQAPTELSPQPTTVNQGFQAHQTTPQPKEAPSHPQTPSLPTGDLTDLANQASQNENNELFQKTVTDERIVLPFQFPRGEDFGATQPNPIKVQTPLHKHGSKTLDLQRRDKPQQTKRSMTWLWFLLLLLVLGLGVGAFVALYAPPKETHTSQGGENCPTKPVELTITAHPACKIVDKKDTTTKLVPALKRMLFSCHSHHFPFQCEGKKNYLGIYVVDKNTPSRIACKIRQTKTKKLTVNPPMKKTKRRKNKRRPRSSIETKYELQCEPSKLQ